MRIVRHYDPDNRCLSFTLLGEYRVKDLQLLRRTVRGDHMLPEAACILLDFRLGTYTISLPQLTHLIDTFSPLPDAPSKRIAILAKPGVVAGILRRYLAAVGLGGVAHVFYTLTDAMAWLEIDLELLLVALRPPIEHVLRL